MKFTATTFASLLAAGINAASVLDIGVINVFTADPFNGFGTGSHPLIARSAHGACTFGTSYAREKFVKDLVYEDTVVDFCDKGPGWWTKTIPMDDGGHIRFNGCSHGQFINVVYTTSDGRSFTDQCKSTQFQCRNDGNGADHWNYRCGNIPV